MRATRPSGQSGSVVGKDRQRTSIRRLDFYIKKIFVQNSSSLPEKLN
jgi:hypothetical protein